MIQSPSRFREGREFDQFLATHGLSVVTASSGVRAGSCAAPAVAARGPDDFAPMGLVGPAPTNPLEHRAARRDIGPALPDNEDL